MAQETLVDACIADVVKLTYRFEGMTKMIKGAFMDDLGEILTAAQDVVRN